MKKMLLINGSPRDQGADAKILDAVGKLGKKHGYESERIEICDLDINGCKACTVCKRTGKCAQNDDMTPLYNKIRMSDMIVIASPVYFGAETGQLKCFMDRFYAMVGNKDGVRTVDIGSVKRASVILTCGAQDGDMTYGGVMGRMLATFKSFGITDVSGAIIPGSNPKTVMDTEFVKNYIDSVDFQLEM